METTLLSALCQARAVDPASYQGFFFEHLVSADFDALLTQIDKTKKGIIIVYQSSSVQAKKLNFFKTLHPIEYFQESELKLLIRGHRLIPPHVRVDEKRRLELESIYGAENLPVLLTSDPMTRLYGFKKGDVIRIERRTGKIYYRRVSEE